MRAAKAKGVSVEEWMEHAILSAARERQEIQRQIDAFQQAGGASGTVDVDELLARKMREARAAQAEG